MKSHEPHPTAATGLGAGAPLLAVVSGACAALAAASTKLLVHPALQSLLGRSEDDLLLRAACLLAVAGTNGAMWYTFSRALARARTTVQVTTLNTFTNMLCTALLGTFAFGESLPARFWAGLLLVCAGTLLLNRPAAAEAKGKAE
ncbi:hypothetical protein H9P43_009645 [Blastocladiella emersonii ATCC 22665]|nr:hypothetical protein H9P43_009645 [Blastocladiella emersonii ATCC 22665]